MRNTLGLHRGITGTAPSARAERSRSSGGWRQRKCSNCNSLRDQQKGVARAVISDRPVNDHDLYACPAAWRQRDEKPVGLPVAEPWFLPANRSPPPNREALPENLGNHRARACHGLGVPRLNSRSTKGPTDSPAAGNQCRAGHRDDVQPHLAVATPLPPTSIVCSPTDKQTTPPKRGLTSVTPHLLRPGNVNSQDTCMITIVVPPWYHRPTTVVQPLPWNSLVPSPLYSPL
jgi:hypothetical protein